MRQIKYKSSSVPARQKFGLRRCYAGLQYCSHSNEWETGYTTTVQLAVEARLLCSERHLVLRFLFNDFDDLLGVRYWDKVRSEPTCLHLALFAIQGFFLLFQSYPVASEAVCD